MSYTFLAVTLVYNLSSAANPQPLALNLNATTGLTIDWGGLVTDTPAAFNGTGRTISPSIGSIPGNPSSFIVQIYGASTSNNISALRAFTGQAFLTSVTFDSTITTLRDLNNAFNGATRLTTITNSPFSLVTRMDGMLRGASIFNQDISSWDVSSVTNMSEMFRSATAFNQDISVWNVGNVTNMVNMFNSASSFNRNLTNWNISKVTSIDGMFNSSTSFNNGGVALAWGNKTSLVTNMNNVFNNAQVFNQDISGWNTSNVNQMIGMFQNAYAFNQNISGWDVSKVGDMTSMFGRTTGSTSSFNQNLSNWNVIAVTNMSSMFSGTTAFNNGGVTLNWGDKTANVTDMNSMFSGATAFNVDISNWNTSKVTNMSSMFFNSVFNRNLLRNGNYWNTSNVTNMGAMFRNATLFNGNISNWDVGKVTQMPNMFNNAQAFNQDISGWNVSNCINFGSMFNNARAFNQNLGNWNVAKATSFGSFLNSTSVTNLNYDSLLIGWANLASSTGVNSGLGLDGGRYYTIAASGARSILTSPPRNWVITDNFLSYSISPATGTFNNTGSSTLNFTGTSSVSTPYTYVIEGPNVGSFTSLTGTFSNIGGTNYRANPVYTPPVGYIGGVTGTWYFRSTTSTVGIQSESTPINLNITCLHSSTYVLTPLGYRPITELIKGDLILTDDNRTVEITEISHTKMVDPEGRLLYKICKDAIKPSYPPQDVLLSYGHSVLLEPEKGNLDGEWIMVKDMIGKYPGVIPQPSPESFDLYHLHLPSFFDDNLVVNGGFVVESMGDYKTIWEELPDGKRKKDPKLRY